MLFFFPPLVLLVSDYFLAYTHHGIFEVLPLSRTAASCINDRDSGFVCSVGMSPQLDARDLCYKYNLFNVFLEKEMLKFKRKSCSKAFILSAQQTDQCKMG